MNKILLILIGLIPSLSFAVSDVTTLDLTSIYSVVIVGYMANNLIPIRIGEVIRAYYLSLREGCSTSAAFGTVAVERATDVLALLFFLGAAGLMSASGVERAFGDISSNVPGGTLAMVVDGG